MKLLKDTYLYTHEYLLLKNCYFGSPLFMGPAKKTLRALALNVFASNYTKYTEKR